MVCWNACAISVNLYFPTSEACKASAFITMLLLVESPDATSDKLSVLYVCEPCVSDNVSMRIDPTKLSGLVEGKSATTCPLTLNVSVIKFSAFAFNVSSFRSNLIGGYVELACKSAVASRSKEILGSCTDAVV